jgi:citrate lyase alpha subunit
MTDSRQPETREVKGDDTIKRSGGFSPIVDTVQALGGPAAIAAGAGIATKHVKDVVVAKIQADAQVEVARLENGYPQEGGAHRAE